MTIQSGERVVFTRDDDGVPAGTQATFRGPDAFCQHPYYEVQLDNGCMFNAHIDALRTAVDWSALTRF